MRKRIWELDALRGLCVLGMVIIHLMYDVVELYRLVDWSYPTVFLFIRDWGGVLFLLISGICVTLGSHPVRRGIAVFVCGLLCTAVTGGMVILDYAGKGMIIWFGVLHCLGICMLLWPLFRKLPVVVLAVLALCLVAAGFYLDSCVRVSFPWLIPFGVVFPGFSSSDYFPLLPHLGFFLLGAVLGRTLYRKKESLVPGIDPQKPIPAFLCFCGKHSLWIYLLHQPVLTAVLSLITLFQ